MLLYAAACGISIAAAARGTAPPIASAAVGLVALAWAILWVISGPKSLDLYTHMLDGWEMQSVSIEEAREVTGLLIVAAWMAVVTLRDRHLSK